MVLWKSTTKNDLSGAGCIHCHRVELDDVLGEVDDETWFVERLDEEAVAYGAISDAWAEDGYVVFVAPVVYALFIIYLLSHPVNDT